MITRKQIKTYAVMAVFVIPAMWLIHATAPSRIADLEASYQHFSTMVPAGTPTSYEAMSNGY